MYKLGKRLKSDSKSHITLKVSKKWLSLSAMTLLVTVLVGANLTQASAMPPQPTGSGFTWATVSAEASGQPSSSRAVSENGRYLVFMSYSPLFVEGDTNAGRDIFVKDMQTGLVKRASVDNSGAQLSNVMDSGVISPNGQYVGFAAVVSGHSQAYVRDIVNDTTTLVSSDSSGTAGNNDSFPLCVTNSGKLLIDSFSTNLDPSVTSGAHVYLKNMSTGSMQIVPFVDPTGSGHTWLVNNAYGLLSEDGNTVVLMASDVTAVSYNTPSAVVAQDLANGTAQVVSYASTTSQSATTVKGGLSDNGRYALFYESNATWSSSGATLFMRDLQSGTITPIDQAPSGVTNNGVAYAEGAAVKDDGSKVGFFSTARNLDAGFSSSSTAGTTISAYLADTATGAVTMRAFRLGAGQYAIGVDKFFIDTNESIDGADPGGADVYVTN